MSNPRTARNPRTDRTMVSDPKWVLTSTGMVIMGTMRAFNTYPEFLAEIHKPDLAYVRDATADPTVTQGSAIYKVSGSLITKIWESEAYVPPVPECIFINQAQEIMVLANHKYFAAADLDATLPLNAADGSTVTIAILEGGQNSTVKAPEGQSLDGSSETLALNSPGQTFNFVFNQTQSKWVQF